MYFFSCYVKNVNLLGNLKIFIICVRVPSIKKTPPKNQSNVNNFVDNFF